MPDGQRFWHLVAGPSAIGRCDARWATTLGLGGWNASSRCLAGNDRSPDRGWLSKTVPLGHHREPERVRAAFALTAGAPIDTVGSTDEPYLLLSMPGMTLRG